MDKEKERLRESEERYRTLYENAKQAEQTLKESQEKYRLLVENQSDLVVKVDNAGTFLYVSPSYCKVFGKLESELIGNSFLPLVHEEDIEPTKKEMEKLYEPPYTCYIEQRAMTKDGWRWFSWSDTAEVSASNEIVSIIGVGRDITDRKHAEEALQNKERYQRALLDNFPFAVWLKDTESRFLAVNQMFAKTFGASSTDELIGKTDFDIAPRDMAEGYRADDRAVLESRRKKSVEERVISEGTPKWFETYKAPVIGKDEMLLGTVGFMRDITERKEAEESLRESEERFRKFLQDVQSVAVQGYAPDGTTQYWNQASELLYGYTAQEAIGKNLLDLIIPPEMRFKVEHEMRHMAETGQPIPSAEVTLMRKDGSRVVVLTSHAVVQMAGRKQELFCIDIDLTERKATEQLLLDMQRRESIGILAGGIAHDFNNLLGSMMGNTSLAQTRLDRGHPAHIHITKALSAMERAAELTQQMLAYSGKGKFQTGVIDVGAMVSEHASLFKVSLSKNVRLETHLPSTGVYVNGDAGQIEQIIMNLIINGGEAIGEKQGVVTITLQSVTLGRDELMQYSRLTASALDEGRYALLEVKDDGIGMDRETISKIFDPFFTTKFTGRGLGLAAVLGIIQGHKGGISVESAEGAGTTFRIVLPAVVPPASDEQSPQDGDRLAANTTSTILVIDDEYSVADMVRDLLEAGNYSVLVELNPISGIELYKQRRSEIGAVLLDLTMPEMSGKEVVDALRAIDPGVKIILSSGYAESEMQKRVDAAKVSGFLQKPYALQSLLATVQRVLE